MLINEIERLRKIERAATNLVATPVGPYFDVRLDILINTIAGKE
jgi:hypothetical protein